MEAPKHKLCGQRHWAVSDCPAAYHGDTLTKTIASIKEIRDGPHGVIKASAPFVLASMPPDTGQVRNVPATALLLAEERIAFLESEVARLKRELAAAHSHVTDGSGNHVTLEAGVVTSRDVWYEQERKKKDAERAKRYRARNKA